MTERLVVSTHLDDAALSCWDGLALGTAVLTVFAGIPADGRRSFAAGPDGEDVDSYVRRRRREDQCALAALSCTPQHLDEVDALYVGAGHVRDVGSIARSVAEVVSDAEELWLPLGFGTHPDHHAMTRVVSDLLPGLVARGASVVLYADYPYWLNVERRHGARGRERALTGWVRGLVERLHLPDRPEAESVWVDEAKLDTVVAYTSQRQDLERTTGGEVFVLANLLREYRWRL